MSEIGTSSLQPPSGRRHERFVQDPEYGRFDLTDPDDAALFQRVQELLILNARRRQEEAAAREREIDNRRALFELDRDQVYLCIEIAAVGIFTLFAVLLWIGAHGEASFGALGGGAGLSRLAALMHKRSAVTG